MAFRKKAHFILTHKPDVLIVPECEHPDKLKLDIKAPIPTDILWYRTNQNKGLAVFSYSDYILRLLDVHNIGLKIILPIAVTCGTLDYTLLQFGHTIRTTPAKNISAKYVKPLITMKAY